MTQHGSGEECFCGVRQTADRVAYFAGWALIAASIFAARMAPQSGRPGWTSVVLLCPVLFLLYEYAAGRDNAPLSRIMTLFLLCCLLTRCDQSVPVAGRFFTLSSLILVPLCLCWFGGGRRTAGLTGVPRPAVWSLAIIALTLCSGTALAAVRYGRAGNEGLELAGRILQMGAAMLVLAAWVERRAACLVVSCLVLVKVAAGALM